MSAPLWKIGEEFLTAASEYHWRVTDVGSRVIVAIEIDARTLADPFWADGPPYSVFEAVFDEYAQKGMTRRQPEP
jgi:hypothetical protein